MRIGARPGARSVVYLLGGPPRTAKTTLGCEIARRHGIGWLSIDWIRGIVRGLDATYPFGDVGDVPEPEAEAFRGHLEHLVEAVTWTVDAYLLEGVTFLPRDVVALDDRRVRPCFVGVESTSYATIARYGRRTPWHTKYPRSRQKEFAPWIVDWSQKLRAECAELGMPYVDVTAGPQNALPAVEKAFGL